MKLIIDIDDEMVCNDIKNKALEPTSATDEVIINALYNGTPYNPQGEWIKETSGYYSYLRCNKCNSYCSSVKTNFCPNCGADMRGKE